LEVDIEEMARSLPPEARTAIDAAGYLEPDRLAVGDAAPPIALTAREDGRTVTIGGPGQRRPTVLIFGSYT